MVTTSPGRGQRAKGLKVKHCVQLCLLLGVGIWLLYQLRHTQDKKSQFEVSTQTDAVDTVVKLGRKDLSPAGAEEDKGDGDNGESEREESDEGREEEGDGSEDDKGKEEEEGIGEEEEDGVIKTSSAEMSESESTHEVVVEKGFSDSNCELPEMNQVPLNATVATEWLENNEPEAEDGDESGEVITQKEESLDSSSEGNENDNADSSQKEQEDNSKQEHNVVQTDLETLSDSSNGGNNPHIAAQ